MAKINIDHIEWFNNMDPALCAENLNKNQEALEACVEIANKFNGLTNVSNEKEPNYPKSRYLVNAESLKHITNSIKSKGVESTGIFANIPSEIRSIQAGGGKELGYIPCKNTISNYELKIVEARFGDKWGNGLDYVSTTIKDEIRDGEGTIIAIASISDMAEYNTDSIGFFRSASWCVYEGTIHSIGYTPKGYAPDVVINNTPTPADAVIGKVEGLTFLYKPAKKFKVSVDEGYILAYPTDSNNEEYWNTKYYENEILPLDFNSATTYKFRVYKKG